MSAYDEFAMKSFQDVLRENPNILEQLNKEVEEWFEERYGGLNNGNKG